MNHIKIIFFDIDGTLIDMHQKKLTPKMIACIKALQSKGIKLIIATGRSPLSLPVFEEVSFDAYLTFNGSLCFQNNDILYHQPIPKKDVLLLLENAKKLHRPLAIATKDELVANGYDDDLADYYRFAHLELKPSPRFHEVLQQDIYQIMMGAYACEYDALLAGINGAKIAAWWDRAIDIIPATGGKGVAVTKILEAYHFSKEEALAFGDGNNDIEMLQSVGRGIAMGNASDALKEIADDICGPVSEDGIYHYCKKHHLI